MKTSTKGQFSARFKQRADNQLLDKAKAWFDEHFEQLEELGKNKTLQGAIFGPLNELMSSFGNTTEDQVKRTITQVAIANGVLAGLPGKLGVGVVVCMALEAWMAWRIASHMKIKLDTPADIFKYVSVGFGIAASIFYLFVHVLRAVFTLLAAAPAAIPATFMAEFITTNFFGVLFWLAFKAAGSEKTFTRRMLLGLIPETLEITRSLVKHQWNVLKTVLNPANLKGVARRLWVFLSGKRPAAEAPRQRGEILASACLAHLLQNRTEAFESPLGDVFLQSIRDRWKDIGPDASAEQIAEFMKAKNYTAEQLEGVIHVIKGKMFEHLVVKHENADGDQWIAHLHKDESFPGSDIVLTNTETGQEIELSLKATDNPDSIDNALLRYPEFPILTTSDLEGHYAEDARVDTSEWSDEELERIARGNWKELAQETADRWDTVVNVSGSSVCVRIALLWPVVVQTLRGKRSKEELEKCFREELGDGGTMLAKRIVLSAALDALYVWILLARGILELTPSLEENTKLPALCLEYQTLGT